MALIILACDPLVLLSSDSYSRQLDTSTERQHLVYIEVVAPHI